MEFNDLEHYTLSLLLDTKDPDFTPEHAEDFPSEAALSIRRNYKEVMIDEYQDTNGIQELITTLLSNGITVSLSATSSRASTASGRPTPRSSFPSTTASLQTVRAAGAST